MVGMRLRVFFIFFFFFITLLFPAGASGEARVIGLYVNGDLSEVTTGFSEDLRNVTLRYDLMYGNRLLDSKIIDLGNMPAGNVTRIALWDDELEENTYVLRVYLFVNGELADSQQTTFVHGNEALLEFKVAGFNSDNKGAVVVISPTNLYRPSIVDLTFEIYRGDELVYSETLEDVSVIQSMEKSIKWPILLENGREYITVLKVHSQEPDTTSAYISVFTANQDVEIISDDVELDEYGASVTLLGMSQAPFYGKVAINLINGEENISFYEETDVITLNKEDTVGFLWEDIPSGNYTVKILAINIEGKTLDSYETAVKITELPAIQPEQTNELPGLNVVNGIAVFLAVFFLLRINRG